MSRDMFAPGAHIAGRVTYPGYEHIPFEFVIERMETERLFSWRWHPAAIEPGVDYSHCEGWDEQMINIERHVAGT